MKGNNTNQKINEKETRRDKHKISSLKEKD